MSRWPLIALIPISIAFAYGASVKAPFVYDDRIHILENDAVIHFESVFDAESMQRIRTHAFGLDARPLLFVTYGMNYATSGASPESFRLTNLAIHLTNSVLVFWIVLELANAFPVALVASLLFAGHPLLTESVTYIAGRSSSLCATFYFTGILATIAAGRSKGGRQWLLLMLALALAGLGYLIKQDAVALPVAMIAIFWIAWPESTGIRRKVVATCLCILFLVFLVGAQRQSIAAVESTSQGNEALVSAGFERTIPFTPYVFTSVQELTTYYLWRMFLPIRLSVDPEPTIIDTPLAIGFLLSVIVILGLIFAAIWLLKRD